MPQCLVTSYLHTYIFFFPFFTGNIMITYNNCLRNQPGQQIFVPSKPIFFENSVILTIVTLWANNTAVGRQLAKQTHRN